MKKILLVFPIAAILASCSTSKTGTTASTSMNSSTGVAGTTGTASISSSAGASDSTRSASASISSSSDLATYVPGPETGYDPNNYMQNPERYIPAHMLTKTGGWTFNNDLQRNKNFAKEAEGTWQLVLTPEVATSWIKDTSRPDTYASYWTPEAVAGRQELLMIAAAKTADSLRVLDSIATIANAPAKRSKSGKYAKTKRTSAGANASATAGVSATGETSASASVTGSGTTGQMGTGGMAATTAATPSAAAQTNASSALDSSGNVATSALTAVNGNNFLLPGISLHIGNGTFTAYTGCNDAIGTITMNGNKLQFTQTAPLNNIRCIGGFDQASFIDRLSRADSYDMTNGQIRFKQGEQ
ncbi:MAG TPA: hypothetical protein VF610_10490, partial [Segetibacter sp.]